MGAAGAADEGEVGALGGRAGEPASFDISHPSPSSHRSRPAGPSLRSFTTCSKKEDDAAAAGIYLEMSGQLREVVAIASPILHAV